MQFVQCQLPHAGKVFDLSIFYLVQSRQLFAENVDNAVVPGGHLVFECGKTAINFLKPLTALCNETASFGNEEKDSGGKDADDAEFFDSL